MAPRAKPPAIDPADQPVKTGASYPAPFDAAARARRKRVLGDPAGLTQFGVNLVELPPGCWSSQRHWHSHEDEFVFVLEGEVILVTNEGEQRLTAGRGAGFPAGTPNGHHLINRSASVARYLEIGSRSSADECQYPDIDLRAEPASAGGQFTDKKGKRY
jgi:uncharacterized cupin superfamily protein